MSDSPTGDALVRQALDAAEQAMLSLRDQRDAAEKKFIAIRAENDDLLEEAAHNAKQLRAAQIRAAAADPGVYTFTAGVWVGITAGVLCTSMGLAVALFWSIWHS